MKNGAELDGVGVQNSGSPNVSTAITSPVQPTAGDACALAHNKSGSQNVAIDHPEREKFSATRLQ